MKHPTSKPSRTISASVTITGSDPVALSRTGTDLDKLNAALSEARGRIETAGSDRDAAERDYRAGLLDAESAELERLQAAKGRAAIDHDRAEALVAALTARIATVREAEARAERQKTYLEATRKCDAIRARLPGEYRIHALAIRNLLRDLAEAEVARERAAAEAPDLPPIPAPEADLRTIYGLQEEIVSTETVRLWTIDGRREPVADNLQQDVVPMANKPGRGNLYLKGGPISSGVTFEVTLRAFTRTRFRERIGVDRMDALHHTVALPGFNLFDPAFVTPEPYRDYGGALIALSTELPAPEGLPERPIRERLEMKDEPPRESTSVRALRALDHVA